MSPERPPSSDGGPALESPNMVLSSIPIESGHVLQQQHHQQIPQQQQYHQSISHAITNGNYTFATSPSSTTSSKLLVLQPNQLNDSYITSKKIAFHALLGDINGDFCLVFTNSK